MVNLVIGIWSNQGLGLGFGTQNLVLGFGLGFESRIFNVLVGVWLPKARIWSPKIIFRSKFDQKVVSLVFSKILSCVQI